MRIAIIGGGLTGLTLAYYLQKAGVAYDLFEASERAGGNLLSPQEAVGYQLEAGPNSLLLSPELEELLTELGLQEAIQEAAPVSAHRYVLRGGAYQALPASPPKLLASSFFSLKTKLRLLAELLRRPAPPVPGETIAAFFT
ncbi:MAG: FAD-dependent oxidoreductase, partial [Cytophagaceae bacterium]